MKTGCTSAILAVLRRARRAMTSAELVEALGRRFDGKAISSALGNLVRQGRIRRIRLVSPMQRCTSAYSIRPVKEAQRPRSSCLLAEVYG